ncbi:MAG: uridine kinase [Promethearchaeota archaeon]
MLEDVILLEQKHTDAAKELIDLIDFSKDKLYIAIGGESGCGKSSLAHMLARLLKEREIYTKILHTDDFYIVPPKQRNEWRRNYGIENIGPSEYDWDKIDKCIHDFKENCTSIIPCVDLMTDQVDILTTNFLGIKVVLLEGLFSLQADADIRIFIDITYIEEKKAQILRGKEKYDEFRIEVLDREHEEVQRLKKNADFVLNKQFKVVR